MESASLYSDCFYLQNANVHADAFSSPKQTILHKYRNEINTVNQLQLNYSTNIHLLIPWFMKSSCVITIQLNTLTDVPYKMMVGGVFVYVRETVDPDDRVIMELQCNTKFRNVSLNSE